MTSISGARTAQTVTAQASNAQRQDWTSSRFASPGAAWPQSQHPAACEAEAALLTIRTLAERDPGALSLQLAQQDMLRQLHIAALREELKKAPCLFDATVQEQEVIDTFEKIMTEANEGTVKRNGDILGTYADFMSGLSSLMVKINASVTAAKDGKSNLNAQNILKAIDEFAKTFTAQRRTLGSFSQEKDALAFQARFRGNTTEIIWNGHTRKYDIRLGLSGLNPVLDVIAQGPDSAASLKKLFAEGRDLAAWVMLVRLDPVTSPTVQALSLATSDVQKTFQTDLDLQINELSRSISQFDNLVKLFSSMVASLTDTYKMFLA